ncbi:MAG: DUF3362 domain-containing protein, partial [Moraxellaceae bacterium]
YHDPNNWPLLRDALKSMGRSDLIGNTKQHLIPTYQPQGVEGEYNSARKKNSTVAGDSQKRASTTDSRNSRSSQPKRPQKGQILTQHTGLPPREQTLNQTSEQGRKKRPVKSR